MTKTTREIEQDKNHTVFLTNLAISLFIAIILFIIIMSIRYEIKHELKDQPHKVCWNETITEDLQGNPYNESRILNSNDGGLIIKIYPYDGVVFKSIKKCNWQDNEGNVLFVYNNNNECMTINGTKFQCRYEGDKR